MKKKKWILIICLILGVGLLISKPLYNYCYNHNTVENYNKLQTYSQRPLTSVKEARKLSKKQLTATIVYRPNCKTCHDTVKKLLAKNNNHKYMPFNVENGNEPKIKHLMEQLNSKQVPSVVVWENGDPAFVFVCSGSNDSINSMIKVLQGKNIDNQDRKITRINQTAYYFHNDKSNVIARNEIVPLDD